LKRLNGRQAKNPSEIKCYEHLVEFIPKTMKVEYEPITLDYTTKSTYRPDYVVSFINGSGVVCYCEYKGNGRAFDNSVRQKMIAVKDQHPDKKFYIIFHKNGKCGPKRKNGSFMTQADWATKNGFEYCIGTENIPKEWFE